MHKKIQLISLIFLILISANCKPMEKNQLLRKKIPIYGLGSEDCSNLNLEQQQLLIAVAKGKFETAKDIIENEGVDPEEVITVDKITLIHAAAGNSVNNNAELKIIKYLKNKKLSLSARTTRFGQTPLSIASNYHFNHIVKYLLENDVNPNVKVKIPSNLTPLHLACFAVANKPHINLETVKLLVNFGADVNAKTSAGSTPLDMANWEANNTEEGKKVRKFLIENGAVSSNKICVIL